MTEFHESDSNDTKFSEKKTTEDKSVPEALPARCPPDEETVAAYNTILQQRILLIAHHIDVGIRRCTSHVSFVLRR